MLVNAHVNGPKTLTGHNHSLAAHDEDDLHRTELMHTELLASINCVSKLADEDDTEISDACRCQDSIHFLEPEIFGEWLVFNDENTVQHHLSHAETDASNSECHRNNKNGSLLPTRHVGGYDSGLRDERSFHDDLQQGIHDLNQHAVREIASSHARDVPREIGIGLKPGTGVKQDFADKTDHVQQQCRDVQAKDDGGTLLRSGQQAQEHKGDDGSAKLTAIVDAADYPFLDVLVEVRERDVHGATVAGGQCDVLLVGVE